MICASWAAALRRISMVTSRSVTSSTTDRAVYVRPWMFGVVACAATLLLYARILHAPFVFDDRLMTGSLLTQATSLSKAASVLVAPVPRKLTRASFAFNFYLGRLDPFGYHLV